MRSKLSRRIAGAAVIAIAFAVALSDPATAGPGDGGGIGSGGKTGNVIAAQVTYSTGGTVGGGDGCTWRMIDGKVSVPNMGTVIWPRIGPNGAVYHLWERFCGGEWGGLWEFPEAQPQDLLPGLLSRLKERELPAPVPLFEHLDPEFGWAYVRVPLDFRADGGSWQPVSVTASIGPLWATVIATPESLVFDPGDPAGPGPVSCNGDGPVAPYVAERPGACSYTYLNASSTSPFDGYHFQTSFTIDWAISWTSSTGAGGVLEPFSTSATEQLAVAEVQGLVTCTGSRPEQGGC